MVLNEPYVTYKTYLDYFLSVKPNDFLVCEPTTCWRPKQWRECVYCIGLYNKITVPPSPDRYYGVLKRCLTSPDFTLEKPNEGHTAARVPFLDIHVVRTPHIVRAARIRKIRLLRGGVRVRLGSKPVWSPLYSPPNVEEKCGTWKKSVETWKQYLESFQELTETLMNGWWMVDEWLMNG